MGKSGNGQPKSRLGIHKISGALHEAKVISVNKLESTLFNLG